MSKILVTGGAGFIGSHLSERLVAAGHQVTVVDNLSSGTAANLRAANVRLLKADISDLKSLQSELEGTEYIYHLAALISGRESLDDPEAYLDTNLVGTLRVVELARSVRARRIVFASSSTVYGNAPEPVRREDAVPQPITAYALSKLASEHLLAMYAPLYGFSQVSLRLFNVYGPRQSFDNAYANVACRFARAGVTGDAIDVFGDGQQSRDFVYVDDVVSAFVTVMNESRASVYNVGSGEAVSINQLRELVEATTGRKLASTTRPPWPNDIRSIRADVSRMSAEFGFKAAVALTSGLQKSVAHFRDS